MYLTAKGVTNDQQLVALLLHTGGAELQELYFTLVDEEEEKSFKACVRVLDEHFVPKANLPIERHQFRQMSQLNSEKVDRFVSHKFVITIRTLRTLRVIFGLLRNLFTVYRNKKNDDMENRLDEDHKLSQGTYGSEKHQEGLGKPDLCKVNQEPKTDKLN